MENLIFCLNATVPIFALMVLGFFARKINLFQESFADQANKFVFKFALPVLLFQDLASTDFFATWDSKFIFFCFGITLASILIAFLLSLIFRRKYNQGEFIQATYRSSAALLGIALIQNIYGDAGMAPLMMIVAVPVYNIAAVVVLELFRPGNTSFNKEVLTKSIIGILKNPIIIGSVLGILWSLLRVPMPTVVSKTLTYVSNLASPLGLMAMGAAFDFKKAFGCLKPALVCAFMKLIGFASIFLPVAIALGFRNSHLIAILIMLGSATTVSSFVMARNMDHDGVLSSSVVMLTTFFSAFTLTAWLFILRSGGFI